MEIALGIPSCYLGTLLHLCSSTGSHLGILLIDQAFQLHHNVDLTSQEIWSFIWVAIKALSHQMNICPGTFGAHHRPIVFHGLASPANAADALRYTISFRRLANSIHKAKHECKSRKCGMCNGCTGVYPFKTVLQCIHRCMARRNRTACACAFRCCKILQTVGYATLPT